MNKLKLITAFLLLFSIAKAQTIKPEEAKDYIGKEVKVCGKVYGVYQAKGSKGQPTYINFGAKYPDNIFSALVWIDARLNFSYQLEELNEKDVCVKGTIKLNQKQKPEIIISETGQIEK